ncbi:hypothetical protein BD309DRAFT_975539 [Dichomitus squalens]|nr:hypothetical protein BD309DRAFT_975539 [Dichomitus squalens]
MKLGHVAQIYWRLPFNHGASILAFHPSSPLCCVFMITCAMICHHTCESGVQSASGCVVVVCCSRHGRSAF